MTSNIAAPDESETRPKGCTGRGAVTGLARIFPGPITISRKMRRSSIGRGRKDVTGYAREGGALSTGSFGVGSLFGERGATRPAAATDRRTADCGRQDAVG